MQACFGADEATDNFTLVGFLRYSTWKSGQRRRTRTLPSAHRQINFRSSDNYKNGCRNKFTMKYDTNAVEGGREKNTQI